MLPQRFRGARGNPRRIFVVFGREHRHDEVLRGRDVERAPSLQTHSRLSAQACCGSRGAQKTGRAGHVGGPQAGTHRRWRLYNAGWFNFVDWALLMLQKLGAPSGVIQELQSYHTADTLGWVSLRRISLWCWRHARATGEPEPGQRRDVLAAQPAPSCGSGERKSVKSFTSPTTSITQKVARISSKITLSIISK